MFRHSLVLLVVAGLAPAAAPFVRVGLYDDPLPPSAKARLGTLQFHGREGVLSSDGKLLARLWNDNLILLMEVETGRILQRLETSCGADQFRFVADGRQLVAVGQEGETAFELWDVKSGKKLVTIDSDRLGVKGGMFFLSEGISADGKRLGMGRIEGGNRLVYYIRDRESAKIIQTITPAHQGGVWEKMSADGRWLLTGAGKDDPLHRVVQVWEVETGKAIRLAVGDTRHRYWNAISPDSKLVAIATEEKVAVWDVKAGKSIYSVKLNNSYDGGVEFSDDGRRLVVRGEDLRIYESSTGKSVGVHSWPFQKTSLRTMVVFPPNGRPLALASRARALEVWDVETGRSITPHSGHAQLISSLQFTPDGRKLLSADASAHVLRWDLATGRADRRFPTRFAQDGGAFPKCLHSERTYRLSLRVGRNQS